MKVCLVYNQTSGKEKYWINSFESANIDYKVVQLDRSDWMEQVLSKSFDFVIALPNGILSYQKQLFDERIYVINNVLGLPIYPSLNELLVYENKRWLSYWLNANNIPHPKTDVFYDFDEAKSFLNNTNYPVVAKSNIGASGRGVYVLKNKVKALSILKKTFRGRGYPRRIGPNLNKPKLFERIFSRISDPAYILKRLKEYKTVYADRDKCILFQEYIPHNFEWRTIKIGDTYISHQKVLSGDRASGSGRKIFVKPPLDLLKFVKSVAGILDFNSGSFDVLISEKGEFLINEIQTYYGTPHIMKVNNVSGRYVNKDYKWVFEEGDFSSNHTNDLRLKHAIYLYKNGQLV